MKVTVKKETKIIIELDKDEAYYLKCLVQNKLNESETDTEKEIRKNIWEELPPLQELL